MLMNNNSYNLKRYIEAGRQRIKDRGIDWKEKYGERSLPLKKRFEKEIGSGSYFRWEGHDYTTDGDYFVVVGPAIKEGMGKCFFAGIKRLPKDSTVTVYSPSGKYFPNIVSAMSYASDKWAIPFPSNLPNYSQADLHDVKVPKHVKA